jgi:LPS export ABC transporter protein LptC
MSINLFFALLLAFLIGMFGYFKPFTNGVSSTKEIPLFELDKFVIYEISPHKVSHFFEGEHGKRFSDRYEVYHAKFTNNDKTLRESISADNALYQNNIIALKKNVHYLREDGLEFRSNEGMYDENHSLITTQGGFVITKENNKIEGMQLNYNLTLDTVSANRIRGSYQLN